MPKEFQVRLPGGPWISMQVPREFAESMGWEVRYSDGGA